MSRNKWIGVGAVALIVAAAITWYFASPWYTLMQIRDAAKANDADKLSAYVDYPALREDLKAEAMAAMAAEAEKDPQYGALGMAIAGALVGPMIDGMVTPAGVRAMLISKERREKAAAGETKTPKAPVEVDENPVIERRSFSEFAVKSKDKPDGAMIFTRRGLGWKLSGVDLPPPETSQNPSRE